jgi:DNA-binding transcriptional LysR family regulator
VWLPPALRILREEAPDIDISISGHSSPELAAGLMQGKVDVAILRREAQTIGLGAHRDHECASFGDRIILDSIAGAVADCPARNFLTNKWSQ